VNDVPPVSDKVVETLPAEIAAAILAGRSGHAWTVTSDGHFWCECGYLLYALYADDNRDRRAQLHAHQRRAGIEILVAQGRLPADHQNLALMLMVGFRGTLDELRSTACAIAITDRGRPCSADSRWSET
jgi:hypothetical protein